MRILILGAGGFIGSNLVEHLCAPGKGHEVVGVDISSEKLPALAPGSRFRFLHHDFTHPAVVEELRGTDVVVDLVAYANPSIYVESPLETFRLNFQQNLQIVEQCVTHGKRLIQYSTCEVYGRPSGDTYHEDSSELICGPVGKQRWIYACGKQLLERVIHAYGLEGQLDYAIVRPFNFVGPRLDYLVPPGQKGGPRVFAQFMSALMGGGPMYLVDGGDQRRSFTHIDDANRAFDVILTHPLARNEIFNVGNPGNDVSIRGLALTMRELWTELTGEAPAGELVDIEGEAFYGPGYDDHTRVPADVGKLRDLGWEPRHGLGDTLRAVMRWYLDHHADDVAEAATSAR